MIIGSYPKYTDKDCRITYTSLVVTSLEGYYVLKQINESYIIVIEIY